MEFLLIDDGSNDPTVSNVSEAYVFLDVQVDSEFSRETQPKKVISLAELLEAAETNGLLDKLADHSDSQTR